MLLSFSRQRQSQPRPMGAAKPGYLEPPPWGRVSLSLGRPINSNLCLRCENFTHAKQIPEGASWAYLVEGAVHHGGEAMEAGT